MSFSLWANFWRTRPVADPREAVNPDMIPMILQEGREGGRKGEVCQLLFSDRGMVIHVDLGGLIGSKNRLDHHLGSCRPISPLGFPRVPAQSQWNVPQEKTV